MNLKMENLVKAAVVKAVDSILASPPPPSPIPSLETGDDLPEISEFLGLIVYFLAFFTSFNDIVESDEISLLLTFKEFEYKAAPIYLTLGLALGVVAYVLSYLQYPVFALTSHGHYFLFAAVFYCFARHLGRSAETPRRRSSVMCAVGTLPLLCLGVIQAEQVNVRSCKFFYTLMLVLAVLPLGTLLRDWRTNSYDVAAAKPKKRLFFLFFALFTFVISTTPTNSCMTRSKPSEKRIAAILCFDLVMLYISSDALWV